MIGVAGWLRVEASDRATYLESCRPVVVAARVAEGCVDFSLSPDPLDDGRINVFEQWHSPDDAERFRESGPSDEQQAMILDAHVSQHEISASVDLTG